MAPSDKFTELRRRVMRRCVYALNTLALRDDRVPLDGAFDAAAANGLAAIVAYSASGHEYEGAGEWVKPPTKLLAIVTREAGIRTEALCTTQLGLLATAIKRIQPLRHGRADEEWDVLDRDHLDALISLDKHPALQVLDLVDGMDFAQASVELYRQEAAALMPLDSNDHLAIPEPATCDSCMRTTLLSKEFDVFGIHVGEGTCIACGEERTYEDTVLDYLDWRFGKPG